MPFVGRLKCKNRNLFLRSNLVGIFKGNECLHRVKTRNTAIASNWPIVISELSMLNNPTQTRSLRGTKQSHQIAIVISALSSTNDQHKRGHCEERSNRIRIADYYLCLTSRKIYEFINSVTRILVKSFLKR